LLCLNLLLLLLWCVCHREDIKAAFAGDIVAIGGLKEVITGETELLATLHLVTL